MKDLDWSDYEEDGQRMNDELGLNDGGSARYCEDYPCCGHTPQDPCNAKPHDWANDPHLTCEHEIGYCEVAEREADEDAFDPSDGERPDQDGMGLSSWRDSAYEENEDSDFDVEDYDESQARLSVLRWNEY